MHARDEMLGIVAHDLRNPLGAIILHTKRMRRRGPEPERRSQRQSEAILYAAGRMSRIIEDLLDVARFESGTFEVECAALDTHALVSEVVAAMRDQAAAREIELRCELPAALPRLWADRQRLLQIFENLIGNALKFTRRGSVTLSVCCSDRDVIFEVADTGVGISPEDLPHVFDRFWQAHTGDRKGAGLGLAIAKNIVAAHGGRIWVESQLGQGSSFFVALPREGTAP